MSLVAYDGSSDEEEAAEQEDSGSKVILLNKSPVPDGDLQNGDTVTFLKLPEPKRTTQVIEEVQDEFLKKKEKAVEKPRRAVKISVPSLAQFDDDEDETEQKVRKEPQKESGLFAVLPPPKGTPLSNKSFIPNVLTRKPRVPAKPKKPPPKKPVIVTNDSTESDDEDIMKDIPETFDEETWKKVCVPRKKQEKRKIIEVENYIAQTQQSVEIAPEPAKPYEGLDNEAFKQLVGSTKRRKENIKLIDINEEEVLPDKDLWLTKSLTDPNMAPKAEEEDPVNDTCKRKHHITYLAQQAKANEQELQSQWSQSKYNRRLTQSKYGF